MARTPRKGDSRMSRVLKCFKDKTMGLNLCILAMLPLAFGCGMCHQRDRRIVGAVLVMLIVANYLCIMRLAGLQIGSPALLPAQCRLHVLILCTVWLVSSVPWFFKYEDQETLLFKLSNVLLVIALALSISLIGTGRAFPIVGAICFTLRGVIPMLVYHPGIIGSTGWTNILVAISLLPVSLVKYRSEQSAMAFVPLAIGLFFKSGATVGHNALVPLWSVLLILCAFTQMLWMRQRRVLPASLRGCKFVSLTYLRKVAASGQGIQRCQDLPSEAFGDPGKAKYLIVVSHRWMDRYTCDVKTAKCPEGLRLQMLLRELDQMFSTAGIGQGKSFMEKLQRFRFAMTGGSDVVLFFDFMSLPQVGKSEDGELIPRTLDESKTFQECLPSMGVLYSMFPVLVSPQVAEDCSTYVDSGWCFSESVTAWLGGQLSALPCNTEVSERFDLPVESDLQDVGKQLDTSLSDKFFLYESDRDIARTMIGSFVLKSRLVHALQNKSLDELKFVLAEISEGEFESIVNQPLDAALNTPLHCAVSLNFHEGIAPLLDAGADKSLVNLYGDTPVQYLMFPRFGRAARLCRRLQGRLACLQESVDSFAKLAPRYTFSSINSTCFATFTDSVGGCSPARQEESSYDEAPVTDIDIETQCHYSGPSESLEVVDVVHVFEKYQDHSHEENLDLATTAARLVVSL